MDRVEVAFPQVLRSILEYLNPLDLASCRLINKAWNAEATHILQRTVTINLSSLRRLTIYCETFERSIEPISLRFQSFHFGANLLYYEPLEGGRCRMCEPWQGDTVSQLTGAYKRFMEVSGDNVLKMDVSLMPTVDSGGGTETEIHSYMAFVFGHLSKMIYESFSKLQSFCLTVQIDHIADGKLHDADSELNVEEFVKNFSRRELPNLKEISLRSNGTPLQSCEFLFGTFIRNLLSSATKLDKMVLWLCWPSLMGMDTEKLLCSFSYFSSNLRCLSIMEPLGNSDLRVITSLNFAALQIVSLVIGKDATSASMQEFLHHYRLFLQKLHLHFWDQNESLFPQLPPPGTVMGQLNHLSLERCSNATLLWRNLPKLEKLVLNGCSNITHIGSNSFDMPRRNFPGTPTGALKTINVNQFQSLGAPETETFPFIELYQFSFLTSLSIECVESPQLSIIFERCMLLRHLLISGCSCVDARTICGIPPSLLEAISHVGNLQMDSSPEAVEAMIRMAKAVHREGPYIGDLSGLQSLTLNADLSDSSVLFGVAQCEQLRRLNLSSFPHRLSWRSKLLLEHGLKHLEKMKLQLMAEPYHFPIYNLYEFV